MPEVGRALTAAMAGRTGLLLRIVLEMIKGDPDTSEGVSRSMGRGLPDLVRYLSEQMAARRLRTMHPVTDRSPQLVMPEVGRALTAAMAGRTVLLLRIVLEMIKGDPVTSEGVSRSMGRGLPDLVRYLSEQMAATH